MRHPYRAPLLVTRCDLCFRRRACASVIAGSWLCRQCIERVMRAGKGALAEFARQGRKAEK